MECHFSSDILLADFVPIGDSSGISVTGETPQERGFRDEEAHRSERDQRGSGSVFFYFICIVELIITGTPFT